MTLEMGSFYVKSLYTTRKMQDTMSKNDRHKSYYSMDIFVQSKQEVHVDVLTKREGQRS